MKRVRDFAIFFTHLVQIYTYNILLYRYTLRSLLLVGTNVSDFQDLLIWQVLILADL